MESQMDTDCFARNLRSKELLRAPTRKRKPNIERRVPRVVKMTWDYEQDGNTALMNDMGVSVLEDEDEAESMPQGPEPTPSVPTRTELIPPGAPKVTVPLNQEAHINNGSFGNYITQLTNPSMYQYIEPQGTLDSAFLFKRSRGQITGSDQWIKLSDEMILSIFKWLPKSTLVKCARVCKRWNRLSLDETLWRRLDLAGKPLKQGRLGIILERGVAILRLTKADIKTPLFIANLDDSKTQRLSRVQYLDLSMAIIEPTGVEELLATCHLLRKLSLENVEVNDQICRYIGQNNNIEVLNMSMCQGLTENGLVPLCNKLQRLDALNVAWANMNRGALVYLVTCLPPSLTKLNLSGCRENLRDEDVQQLCRSCSNLKEFDLSDCTLLTSQSVETIACTLRGLEYIALSRCYHLMPSSLPLLSNILTLLALDVFGMLKETALIQLKQAMPNIEINKFPFSSIARPTTGIRRTSIWGLRVRDSVI